MRTEQLAVRNTRVGDSIGLTSIPISLKVINGNVYNISALDHAGWWLRVGSYSSIAQPPALCSVRDGFRHGSIQKVKVYALSEVVGLVDGIADRTVGVWDKSTLSDATNGAGCFLEQSPNPQTNAAATPATKKSELAATMVIMIEGLAGLLLAVLATLSCSTGRFMLDVSRALRGWLGSSTSEVFFSIPGPFIA